MNSACNFDRNSEGVSDCLESCLETSCTADLLSNTVCDSECDNYECGFDLGLCGDCASGCTIAMLENNQCDEVCNNYYCYYDFSSCVECNSGCTHEMLTNDVCDNQCNFSLCNYDDKNCTGDTECSTGCTTSQLGNGLCEQECNNADCNYDDYDCLCAPGCFDSYLADGECDSACNNEDCNYDEEDCIEKCPDECASSAGDGSCNMICWDSLCDWIDTDCGCTADCAYTDFAACKEECLVLACDYAEIDMGHGVCADTVAIQLAKYYQLITGDFTATVTKEKCEAEAAEHDNTCFTADLDSGVCLSDCLIEECGYSFGNCESDCSECGCDNCCYRESNGNTLCLACDPLINYFTDCVEVCPPGYTEDSSRGWCVEAVDDSSADANAVYYLDVSWDSGSDSYGSGTLDDPFTLLSVALASITASYSQLVIRGTDPIALEPVPDDYEFYSYVENPEKPLDNSQIVELTIEAEFSTQPVTFEILNEDFMYFKTSASLTFKHVRFTTIALSDDCDVETEDYCDYCCLIDCPDDQTNYCEPFQGHKFIEVRGSASLVLNDVHFSNMRNEFDSLISVENGNLQMEDVYFSQITVSRAVHDAVITVDCTESSVSNCGSVLYSNGGVSQLNDGYEIQEPSSGLTLQPFLEIKKAKDVSLSAVNFSFNIVSGEFLLTLDSFNVLTVDSCTIENNLLYGGLIGVSNPSLAFSIDNSNIIQELLYDHLVIKNTTVQYNFIASEGLIKATYTSAFIQNILVEDVTVQSNILADGGILWLTGTTVESYMKESEYTWLEIDGEREYTYYTKQTAVFRNLQVISNILNGKGIFYITKLANIQLDSVVLDSNTNGEYSLDDLVQLFIENTSVTSAYEGNEGQTDLEAVNTFSGCYDIEWLTGEVSSHYIDKGNGFLVFQDCTIVVMTASTFNEVVIYSDSGTVVSLSSVYIAEITTTTFSFCQAIGIGSDGVFIVDGDEYYEASFISCTFANNTSTGSPGIKSSIVTLHVEDCVFANNTIGSDQQGSLAIDAELSAQYFQLNITNTNFTDNVAETGDAAGLSLEYESSGSVSTVLLTIDSCVFTRNSGEKRGSALRISGTIQFDDNSALTNSVFNENTGEQSIVLLEGNTGTFTMDSCTFTSNSAKLGMLQGNTEESLLVRLINSTFSSNTCMTVIIFDTLSTTNVVETQDLLFENNFAGAFGMANGHFFDTNSVIQSNDVVTYYTDDSSSPTAGVYLLQAGFFTGFGTQFLNNQGVKGTAGFITTMSVFSCSACTFQGNTASVYAGVLYVESSAIEISGCQIIENTSQSTASVIQLYSTTSGYSSYIRGSTIAFNEDTDGHVIIAIFTELEISDSSFYNNTSQNDNPNILSSLSELSISSTTFSSQTGDGTLLFFLSMSTVTIDSVTISDIDAPDFAIVYLVSSSVLQISNSQILRVKGYALSLIYASEQSELTISSTTIEEVGGYSAFLISNSESTLTLASTSFTNYTGTALEISKTTNDIVRLQDVTFQNGESDELTAGIEFVNGAVLEIDSCQFQDLISVSGGALYLESDSALTASISNSNFSTNVAESGGAIHASSGYITINDCKFDSNQASDPDESQNSTFSSNTIAGRGGAIYFFCTDADLCSLDIEDTIFSNNQATWRGGVLDWSDRRFTESGNTYEGNSAYYANDVASFPVTLRVVDDNGEIVPASRILTEAVPTVGELSDVASGQGLSEPLRVALVDHYDQIVATDSESQATLHSTSSSVSVSGTTTVTASEGILTFSDISVVAEPESIVSLVLTCNGISSTPAADDEADYNPNVEISFDMRACEPGEVYIWGECYYCTAGTYSFDTEDTACTNCMSNAICNGGVDVVPKAGYWRSSNVSEVIWQCPNSNACLGASNITVSANGLCEVGYKGNMCQSCEAGYSRTSSNTCTVCPDEGGNIAKLLGLLVGIILMAVLIVRSALNSAYTPKKLYSVYFKIFVNYMQLVMLTVSFDLDWPSYVKTMFDIQESAGSASEQVFSLDCYLEEEEGGDSTSQIFFQKVLFMSMLPFLIIAVSTVFWLVVCSYKYTYRYLKEELVATIIVLIFLVHPNIIKIMFDTVNCIEIEDGEWWVVSNMDIACWDTTHNFYAFAVALPSIILWGIAIPALCLCILHKNRKRLHTLSIRKKYGFLFNGYTNREYYWEIVILFRKMSIMFCAVVLSTGAVSVQALCVLIVIMFFLFLQKKFTPFNHESLNDMEVRSILISAVTIYCGLFYLTGQIDDATKLILFIIIVVINLYFLFYWLYKLFEVGVTLVAERVHCLRKYCLKRPLDGYDDELFQLEEKHPHIVGAGVNKMYRLVPEATGTREERLQINPYASTLDLFEEVIQQRNEEFQSMPRVSDPTLTEHTDTL